MKHIIEVLMRGDEVEYGFLGVTFLPDASPGRGVMIQGVARGRRRSGRGWSAAT